VDKELKDGIEYEKEYYHEEDFFFFYFVHPLISMFANWFGNK